MTGVGAAGGGAVTGEVGVSVATVGVGAGAGLGDNVVGVTVGEGPPVPMTLGVTFGPPVPMTLGVRFGPPVPMTLGVEGAAGAAVSLRAGSSKPNSFAIELACAFRLATLVMSPLLAASLRWFNTSR